MYRINRVGRPVLITKDEVVMKAAMEENPDMRFILNSIEIAEERFIVPALGIELYEDFVAQKNVVVNAGNQADLLAAVNASLTAAGANALQASDIPYGTIINAIELVTNADYVKLWNRYLWKVTAEAVDVQSTVPSWIRHGAQGQQKNNPVVVGGNTEGSATADKKEIEMKLDSSINTRVYPMLTSMKKWICTSLPSMPLYDYSHCYIDSKKPGSGGMGIILNAYGDKDRENRRISNTGWGNDGRNIY